MLIMYIAARDCNFVQHFIRVLIIIVYIDKAKVMVLVW